MKDLTFKSSQYPHNYTCPNFDTVTYNKYELNILFWKLNH